MEVCILTNNFVNKRGFLAEHGLSLLISDNGKNILFDTGQSGVFLHNAIKLGINIDATDYIILSHGHYDHCGGISKISPGGKLKKVFVRQTAFERKFTKDHVEGNLREIGIPWKIEELSMESFKFESLKKDITVDSHFSLIGSIPSTVLFENLPEGFFVERNGRIITDMVADEQLLVFEKSEGLVIFSGCSHPGIINCLHHLLKVFPGRKIYALFAGMHLANADDLRIQITVKSLMEMDILNIFPMHCTGIKAMNEFQKYFDKRCRILYSGDKVCL